jgi:sulfate permease, SulP family
MSRSNVRRQYRCGSVRSRRSLDAENMAILESTGSSILVIELQGALFFGSADRLAQEIDTATVEATRWLILDLRRVTDIDSTSMRILVDIETDLARRSIELAVVLHARSETGQRLAELSSRRFPDVDLAIEWAEDNLLDSRTATGRSAAELSLEQIPLLRQFTLEQIARLRPYLQSAVWPAGSTIFNEGDPGSHLFMVTLGRASVRLMSNDHNIRLATFGPGSLFGELALLDQGPRSATVTADERVTTWALAEHSFKFLEKQDPDIAMKILSALGRELSGRLRRANLTIHQLES